MRCDQRSRDSTHDACHVARGLTVSNDTASAAARVSRRSQEHGRGVEPHQQGESVGRGRTHKQPAGHADERPLRKREVRPHQTGKGRAGREGQRGVENDEECGHPTSTQTLICWSAELTGIAVHIG